MTTNVQIREMLMQVALNESDKNIALGKLISDLSMILTSDYKENACDLVLSVIKAEYERLNIKQSYPDFKIGDRVRLKSEPDEICTIYKFYDEKRIYVHFHSTNVVLVVYKHQLELVQD